MSSRPMRALTHPLWVSAVVLLLLNDHVWKGGGVLPSVVTGKLSDFVGMLVAPVLLAAVLRLRSRRGLLGAHVATGLVFAALQLLPSLAYAVALGSSAIGLPFLTTPDPTDLVALPMLAVSWWVFEPVMRANRPIRPAVQRIAGGVGVVACVATSSTPPTVGEFAQVRAQMVLHNDTDIDRTLFVRQLNPTVELGCALPQLSDDAGALLSDALFAPATVWELPPGTLLPLLGEDPWSSTTTVVDGGCHAVLIEQEGAAPHVVAWQAQEPQWFEGEMAPGAGQALEVVSLSGVLGDGDDRVFPLRADAGTCPVSSGLDRVEWSLSDLRGTLVDLVESDDGCHEMVIDDPFAFAEERGYLCIPFASIPFEVGVELDVSTTATGDGRWMRIDEEGLENSLVVAQNLRSVTALGLDATALGAPEGSCGLTVDRTCGHVSTDAGLLISLDGTPTQLVEGDEVELGEGRTLTLVHAQSRLVHHGACGDALASSSSLGTAFDLVLTQRANDSEGEN